jgi:hypothetical protein
MWDAEFAAVYDEVYARQARPSVVEPIAGVLAELAGGGAAIEFAVGTSRIFAALEPAGALPSRGSGCRRTWQGGCAPSPVPMRFA